MFRPVNNNPEFNRPEKPLELKLNGNTYDMSVFGEGFVIEEGFTEVFKDYDTDNNGVLDSNEARAFQEDLKSAAGDDNTLDNKELTQLFGKTNTATDFSEKCGAMFKGLLICLKNGIENVKRYGDDSRTRLESFAPDGSGVVITYSSEDGFYNVSVYEADKDNERQLKEVITHTNADLRKDSDFNQNNVITTGHIIYENGRVVEQNYIHPGDNWTNPYTEYTKFEYDSEGNVSAKYNTRQDKKTGKSTYTATYYNGTRSDDKDDEREQDRILARKLEIITVDGKTSREEIEYNADGINIVKKHSRQEKEDVVIVEEYSGANLSNRLDNMPNRKIIYDKTGTNPQTIINNEFDKNGVLVKQTVIDLLHNKKNVYKYNNPNGKIEHSRQGGIGDCYFLTSLNAMNSTKAGAKILQQSISKEVTSDETGQKHTTYRVSFGGAGQIIEDLTNGIRKLPSEKIYIQRSYTVTEEELSDAMLRAGKDFSSGDRDVLIHEIAYSKYKKDVAKTVNENNIDMGITSTESHLIAGLDVARGWGSDAANFGDGGMLGLTTYLYTGIKGDAYFSPDKTPVCKVGYDGEITVVENSKSFWNSSSIAEEESNAINERYNKIDTVIDSLRKDCKKDGTFKSYSAEVSLSITSQVVNGQEVRGGNHAFTLKAIKDNTVILVNPWNSGEDVVMDLEDFKKATQMLVFTDLTENKMVKS